MSANKLPSESFHPASPANLPLWAHLLEVYAPHLSKIIWALLAGAAVLFSALDGGLLPASLIELFERFASGPD